MTELVATGGIAPRVLRGFTVHPDGTIFGPSGKQLAPFPVNEYLRVTRYTGGGRANSTFVAEPIHRLVCEAYHGLAPEDRPHVRHHDGNALNNVASNLSWSDQPTNEADKVLHGTALLGERHHKARLTTSDVRAIRASSESSTTLGPKYGVTPAHIRSIRQRRTWKHV